MERLEFPRLRELVRGLATSFEGKRRLADLRPFASKEEAEEVLLRVGELKARTEQGSGLPAFDVGDLAGVFRRLRAEGGVLDPEDFLRLAPLLLAVRRAREALESAHDEFPELARLGDPLVPAPHLERALEATFETTGEIKDTASPELRRLRRERETRRERLRAKMERLAGALSGNDQGSLVTLRDGRYVLSVPQVLKSKVPGVVLDRSASGATFFVEPMPAVEDNNALREIDAEERAEIRRILVHLTEAFRAEASSLEAGYDRTAELDGLRARVLLALRWGADRPSLTAERRLRITGGRHPLLLEARGAVRDLEGARQQVVPLDLELDETTRLLLLTGPNMGGKTVALKCVGLMSAMAQSGCLVPADPGTMLPWVERWVVSLGDEQSLEDDLSTFGAHLSRWREALEAAGSRTLVLLDELGSGTDPAEGAALAQSVLERLAEAGAMGLVTSHLGGLKGFAASAEGVQNASMVFDPATRTPTYRLAVGIPGKSHALEMARSLGFPEERVARAEALLPREERDVSRLLDHLAEEQRRLAEAKAQAEEALRRAEQTELERRQRLSRLLEERASIRARAARQAREMIRRAEEILRRVETQNRRTEASRPTRAGARGVTRGHLAREHARLARLESPPRKPRTGPVPREIVVGKRYWSELLGREVEVTRGLDSGGRVLVVQGSVKVELPASSLRELLGPSREKGGRRRTTRRGAAPAARGRGAEGLEEKERASPRWERGNPKTEPGATGKRETAGKSKPETERTRPRGGVGRIPEVETPPTEIDLRGMRVEEALEKLDWTLDRALLAGLHEVRVIHGKGTGALREAVRQFCRSHTAVSSARVAEQWEGGTGATVIALES